MQLSGDLEGRYASLGELNWIFTTITDPHGMEALLMRNMHLPLQPWATHRIAFPRPFFHRTHHEELWLHVPYIPIFSRYQHASIMSVLGSRHQRMRMENANQLYSCAKSGTGSSRRSARGPARREALRAHPEPLPRGSAYRLPGMNHGGRLGAHLLRVQLATSGDARRGARAQDCRTHGAREECAPRTA